MTLWAVGDLIFWPVWAAPAYRRLIPPISDSGDLRKAARPSTDPIQRSAPEVVRLHSPLSRGGPRAGFIKPTHLFTGGWRGFTPVCKVARSMPTSTSCGEGT